MDLTAAQLPLFWMIDQLITELHDRIAPEPVMDRSSSLMGVRKAEEWLAEMSQVLRSCVAIR
jgi:hypothetical protein